MNRLTPYMRIPLRIVYAKAVEMSIVFLRIKQKPIVSKNGSVTGRMTRHNSNIRFSQRIGTKEWTERILQYRQGQQLPLYKMPCFLSGKGCIKNSKIFAGFLAISMLLWYSFL